MSFIQERIAELEAAIAKLESQAAPSDPNITVSLALLRSQLIKLRGGFHSPVADPSLDSERKLVTIMFADISGFTALAETMDPEACRDLVNLYFQRMTPIIEKYHGTIEKFIGDEIMALFGAPIASENDAECALRAALEMAETFGGFCRERGLTLGLHFGINTGLVVAGALGAQGREQYAVTGDAVNLASRLRSASARNEIFVGSETHRLTAPLFEFEKMKPLEVKGKAKPVEVYRLLGAKRTALIRGIEGLRSPLVGRTKEFEQLKGALNGLQQGKGAVIAIVGEAGLGKSRLVTDTRKAFADRISWIEARALSYGERLTYGVARDLLHSLIQADETMPGGEISTRLRTRLKTLLGERAEEVFPYLAHLCELRLDDESTAERIKYLSPEALQAQVARAFEAIVRAEALAQPLAIVCEDLHWIDPSSLRLLETLVPLAAEVPLLLLLVFRSTEEGRVCQFHQRTLDTYGERYHIIHLTPLSRECSTELIENLLQIQNLPPETRLLILDKADGNPFFVEELLRSMIDAGLIVLREGRATAIPKIRELEVPSTLQGLIASRIDRLAPRDKRALQAASVIGRIFQRRVLEMMLKDQWEPAGLEIPLAELQHRELIRLRETERTLPDREYIFKHAVTQDVTYQTLLLARRKTWHRVVAETIEALFPENLEELAATLAYHYERGEVREPAIHYLTKAADRARASYANEEAIEFYRAALRQAGPLKAEQPGRWAEYMPKLHERLGDTLLHAAHYEEARSAYDQALAHFGEGDSVHRARLIRKQGNAWFNQRRTEESLAFCDLAETALGSERREDDLEWRKEWMAVQLDRIGPYYHLSRLTDLNALIERIQPIVEQYGTPSERRDIVDSLNLIDLRRCRYYMLPDETVDRVRKLLAASRETADLSDIAFYQFALGFVHMWREELDQAKLELGIGLSLAIRIGDVAQQTKCLTYLTLSHRKANQVQEVEEYASQSLALAKASQNSVYTAWALANLGWAAWRKGNFERAREQACAALELMQKNVPWRWSALWPLLGIALELGQIESVIDCARGILEPDQSQFPSEIRAALEEAIRSWENSDLPATREHLQRASEKARSTGYL